MGTKLYFSKHCVSYAHVMYQSGNEYRNRNAFPFSRMGLRPTLSSPRHVSLQHEGLSGRGCGRASCVLSSQCPSHLHRYRCVCPIRDHRLLPYMAHTIHHHTSHLSPTHPHTSHMYMYTHTQSYPPHTVTHTQYPPISPNSS